MAQSFETQEAFQKFENILSPSHSTGRQSWDLDRAGSGSSEYLRHYPLVEYELPWSLQELGEVVVSSGKLLDGTGAERPVETFLSVCGHNTWPYLSSFSSRICLERYIRLLYQRFWTVRLLFLHRIVKGVKRKPQLSWKSAKSLHFFTGRFSEVPRR